MEPTGSAYQECTHTEHQVTRRTVVGGTVQVVRQCLACGCTVGSAMAHSSVPSVASLPEFSTELQEREAQRRRARMHAFQQQRATEATQWRTLYNAFIASDQWADIRPLVLKRDGDLCQGCLRARATQVHHKKYPRDARDLSRVPLFDLVSVCNSCHERIHESPRDDG